MIHPECFEIVQIRSNRTERGGTQAKKILRVPSRRYGLDNGGGEKVRQWRGREMDWRVRIHPPYTAQGIDAGTRFSNTYHLEPKKSWCVDLTVTRSTHK